jgi:hypothetical protein
VEFAASAMRLLREFALRANSGVQRALRVEPVSRKSLIQKKAWSLRSAQTPELNALCALSLVLTQFCYYAIKVKVETQARRMPRR